MRSLKKYKLVQFQPACKLGFTCDLKNILLEYLCLYTGCPIKNASIALFTLHARKLSNLGIYQYYFSGTSGLFRISIFLEKAKFPFSQDLATFKFPPKNLQITLWASSWTDFRFVSCYNIQIDLSFNLAPILTPSDLYFGIILTLKQHFLFFFFVKKKLTRL